VHADAGGENALRQSNMHAKIRFVHQLRNGDIAGNADELIGLMAAKLLFRNEKIDFSATRKSTIS
jgi:hypothetical protein